MWLMMRKYPRLNCLILRKQDLEVEVFETGDQLLLRFMEEAADVVILDVMMPEQMA